MEERLANRPQPLVLSDGCKVAYLYRAQNGAGHWHIRTPSADIASRRLSVDDAACCLAWFREAREFIAWAEAEMLAEADRCREYNQLELSRKSSHPLVRKHDSRRFP